MKSLLLAKSNLRKNRGLSIAISLLIIISTMFICVSSLLILDYQKNSYKVAESLNTSQIDLFSRSDKKDIDEEYIRSILPDSVTEYEYIEDIKVQIPIEFSGGEVTPIVSVINKDHLNRNLSKIEILEEDKSIKENYIYVPYHIHTGGGLNIGDTYKLKFPSRTYKFKIKGYINTIYAGSNNMNRYEMLVSDEDYDMILNDNPNLKAFDTYINFKDGIKSKKESNKLISKIFTEKGVETESYDLDLTLESRTFISSIFFVSFLLTSVIIILVVILMISNNISNYIRENIKTLGALKAIGYTSKNIKRSLIIQFSLLTVIGLVIGVLSGYLFMPIITDMLVAQSGIPYKLSFNLISTIIPIISMPILVFIIVLLSVRKINKLDPIIALRDGIETHSFKKNHIPLSKSKLPLNMSISLKNMYKNGKQNIVTFITVLFLCFLMVIAMAMYQNFSRKPKLDLLTFEIVDGIIMVDKDIRPEFVKDLKKDKDIESFKYLNMYQTLDKDYAKFETYIMNNPKLLNNKDNCYEGRYPKHDNEIAISGKYAKENNYKIGDKKEFRVGENKYSFLITGFIQSTNNDSKEILILKSGMDHLVDTDELNPMYYFDSKIKASKVIDKYKDKYGDKVLTTMDFEELIEGQMDTFINVANLMVVVISIITGAIILLVLYLLMKTLIYERRFEYGILKALGFRSRDLIIQNVLSFMPTIIIATIIGTIISYFATNPYIGLMMRPFGIMKCIMVLPIDLLIITVLFIIGVSLIASILMSLKIRKIEPNDLLNGE
ncbi:MAG: ABC transporter permease [Bacilli bacterium]|nr:ABC transporter permease [Bacilli bacterium]